MKTKHKVVLLTILPLLLAMLVLGGLLVHRSQRLTAQQAQLIEETLLASRRSELQHYTQLAMTAIAPLYRSGRNDAATQAQAKAILRDISYGEDGYFFVYDRDGQNVVHPRQPALVGKNLWNRTDPHGRYVIRSLIQAASRKGSGFQTYDWEKPSSGQMTEKLGYVVSLPRWGWVLGTGVYIDDIERATAQIRQRASGNVRDTLWGIAAVATAAVLLVFAGGVVLNISDHRLADAKLRTLTQRLVHTQEQERARVSRELHDGISQLLVSVKFQFELAARKLDGGEGALAEVRKGLAGLGEALHEVRRISHDLRPSVLDMLGLPAALGQLASEFGRRSGIAVQFDNHLHNSDLGDAQAVALFRIAQEAFTNIERHAAAGSVQLSLSREGDGICMTVRDDGCGFDVGNVSRSQTHGIGLRNIHERVDHLGGVCLLQSRPGMTELQVRLPV